MIRIKNLNKIFKKQKVLKNINLEIPKNEIVCFLGPNGSGKTTLIKCLLGLVIPDPDSKLEYENKEIEFNLAKYFQVGYVPQMPLFPRNVLVKDLVDYLTNLENHNEEVNRNIIELLGIHSFFDKKISELSGGMRQKLNLLQCFIKERDIYVLDEPTASLDPYHSHLLKKLIKEKKQTSYVLFITHNLSEVEELADKMVILIDGQIVLIESPKEFIQNQNALNLEDALSKIHEYIKI